MTATPGVVLLHQAAGEAEPIREVFEDQLDGDVTLRVAETPSDSEERLADAEVALTFAMTEAQVEAAGALQWVQAMNAGVDSYPTERLEERGIALTNSSGIHAEQIGQQVLGYLLVFERRIHEGMRQQRAGEWDRYDAGELGDETLGVVGLGAIGSRVAEFGAMMGMDVIGTKRDPSAAPDCVDTCYPPDELDGVLDRAEYLVIACPLTEATRGLVGKRELERLDEHAVLVNIARGPVVDQDALVEALQRETIRGAALDVTDPEPLPADSPLRSMENVVLTPHVAGSTPYYFDRAIELFACNYRAYVAGEELENRVV
jgi:phosphoglycerate dehydrogenase-like enzyme